MWAPLRKGDLAPPPYVAPLGVPRQPPGGGVTRPRATGPSSSVPLEELDGALVLEGSSRVPNVPRFRLRPVRGSFFLEYRRYFPDGSFRIIARLLEDSTSPGSGPAGQLSQERSPL